MSIQSRIAKGFGFGPVSVATFGFYPANQEASSGWRRMMLTELQEESLKQDELRKMREETIDAPAAEQKKLKKVVPKDIPPSKPKKVLVELEKAVLDVHERPVIAKAPEQASPELAPWLAYMTAEFRSWYLHSLQSSDKVAAKAQLDAENDEIITLLLLAA